MFETDFTLLKLARFTKNFVFLKEETRVAFLRALGYITHALEDATPAYSQFAAVLDTTCTRETDMKDLCCLLKKKHRTQKGLFAPRITYKYLFILEVLYIYAQYVPLQTIFTSNRETADLLRYLGDVRYNEAKKQFRLGNKKETECLLGYIAAWSSGKQEELIEYTKNAKLRGFTETLMPLTEFIVGEQSYYKLPRIHVSVYATMSAGKSTFVNALLGHDYLPSKNEACTAKITSIYDNDSMNYVIGYTVKKGQRTYSAAVTNETLEAWNSDPETTEVVLEGDLDGLCSDTVVFVAHDTPGVNYSGEEEHLKITLGHLREVKPAAVLCVLDATQMGTTDSRKALQMLQEALTENKKSEILFVMNKADMFDPQKESLAAALGRMAEDLADQGFKHPVIVPVSARAARLFKMALKGKGDGFSENETDDFIRLIRYFSRGGNDFNALTTGVPERYPLESEYSKMGNGKEITIEGKNYPSEMVRKALLCTGIPTVEYFFNHYFKENNYGGK
ncbi:MAG: dynamin family protein [Treponema sp.]|nr:dynamin family protein [Treponema sp.]